MQITNLITRLNSTSFWYLFRDVSRPELGMPPSSFNDTPRSVVSCRFKRIEFQVRRGLLSIVMLYLKFSTSNYLVLLKNSRYFRQKQLPNK